MTAKLLKIIEAAEVLNVTEDRTYRMIREGLLPVVRLGRQIRIDPAELEKWIKSGGREYAGRWRKEIR